jgi:hypothetical protein
MGRLLGSRYVEGAGPLEMDEVAAEIRSIAAALKQERP